MTTPSLPSRLRVVVYGVGAMGALATRLLVDKGAQIVGAIGRSPDKVGRDLGEVAGLDRRLGIAVEANAAEVLARGADIAVVCVGSYLATMRPHFALCLDHGVNVVTIEEETVFPWTTAQDDAKALDSLAKANGVTLAASGAQDVFWLNLVATLLGASHRIEAVVGRCIWNVDDYGPEVARHLHIGRPEVEFDRHVATFGWPEFVARQTLEALVSCLGMTVASTSSDVTPVVASDFIYCRSLGVELKAGEIMGTIDRTVIDTREGARFELAMEGRLYREGETDDNQWDVFGEPRLSLRNAGVPYRFTTCSTMVNRILDVVAAPPGLLSLDEMPVPSYKRELRFSQAD